jgi:hypothetical protein
MGQDDHLQQGDVHEAVGAAMLLNGRLRIGISLNGRFGPETASAVESPVGSAGNGIQQYVNGFQKRVETRHNREQIRSFRIEVYDQHGNRERRSPVELEATQEKLSWQI